MMKRESLLFVASNVFDPQKETGVNKKILCQKAVLEKYYNVLLVAFSNDGVIVINNDNNTFYHSRNRRLERIKICKRLCFEYSIDKCFIRNAAIEPFFYLLVKMLKNIGVRVIVEIPTYPYDEELKNGVKARIVLFVDKILRKTINKYVDRIVVYSKDKYVYGVKCINIQNGIDIRTVKENYCTPHASNEIHLIGVARVSSMHGYDRIIKGMALYRGNSRFIFHIVGDGPALSYDKELAQQLGIADQVLFTGFKVGKELDEEYSKADLAVATLAGHRIGIQQFSALKIREYCCKGMPCICADNSVDAFDSSYKYALFVPANEEPIDMNKVESFMRELNACPDYKTEIRDFAKLHFDIYKTFMPVIDCFNSM